MRELMSYEDAMPEEAVMMNAKVLGLKEGLKRGHMEWLDGHQGRRLRVTRKGMDYSDWMSAMIAVNERRTRWRLPYQPGNPEKQSE